MESPSSILTRRYQLDIDPDWKKWFDEDALHLKLPGSFRYPVDVSQLCAEKSQVLWSGLIPPDFLPIIGNEYGDWICVRVHGDGKLGELVHWYHGGGDWIPVGRSIQEAVLQDAADQFRPVRTQMLRGALEMRQHGECADCFVRLTAPEFVRWLQSGLTTTSSAKEVNEILSLIITNLESNNYLSAIDLMRSAKWSLEASCCDEAEQILAGSESEKVGNRIDRISALSQTSRKRLMDLSQTVIDLRSDLIWPFDLLGDCLVSQTRLDEAARSYEAGLFASTFSDQAVRLKSLDFDLSFGKQSIARLSELERVDVLPELERSYISIVCNGDRSDLASRATRFWMSLADQSLEASDAKAAYEYCYRAGWDFGAASWKDYSIILEKLRVSAAAANWPALEALATANWSYIHKAN